VPPDAFRVLVTGFGPFLQYAENPSWLAVKPLHNRVMHTDIQPEPVPLSHSSNTKSSSSSSPSIGAGSGVTPPGPRPIHITTLEIPVVYESVLAVVPGLHHRPPSFPADALPDTVSPETNFDFIFHVGVAGRGPLRMERQGHKLGYHMKDATGKLAPVVRTGGDTITRPTRGFGAGYENFPEEIPTDIDVTRLVQDLKRSGVEQIYTSMDAGHYLCDFIYYCSLAEVKRSSKPYEKRRSTQVLFLHCPPVGQPLGTEEVTDAIQRIVVWVCSE
ncbi:hypothetical protein GALMADRAFT_41112, partial [Galerina marginata CBS 339.88]